ncbi:MAG: thiosulfate sulfurtransferase GlpE [Rhodospirillales bacterium]|nr:thiosulfate sulfurtransferase GlpE [Rhodospirillales bacterium]
MSFKHISAEQTKQLINDGDVVILDIRDPASFAEGHIDGAKHIEEVDVDAFITGEDKAKPLVVCCYHGNSSQSAAQFFAEKGFTNVYSLDGGFGGWPEE